VNNLTQLFNRFKTNSILIYCLQILIVLTGTTLGLLWLGHNELIVPVTLGMHTGTNSLLILSMVRCGTA